MKLGSGGLETTQSITNKTMSTAFKRFPVPGANTYKGCLIRADNRRRALLLMALYTHTANVSLQARNEVKEC